MEGDDAAIVNPISHDDTHDAPNASVERHGAMDEAGVVVVLT